MTRSPQPRPPPNRGKPTNRLPPPEPAGRRGRYFVYYDAASGKVRTLDGRETAPATMPHDAFIDPATGNPYPFTLGLVTSGVSVGVPGTAATWHQALENWGSISLGQALQPAMKAAALEAFGHQFVPAGDSLTPQAEIGALEAIEFAPDGTMTAAAEPTRRGGGSAMVLKPARQPRTGPAQKGTAPRPSNRYTGWMVGGRTFAWWNPAYAPGNSTS